LFEVAVDVLDKLLGGGGELVTLVSGADAEELAERCASHLSHARPNVDVVVYDGGQPDYPLFVGVE
jgi:dihydroxyacetone kinase-like predicted kinase